jgi:hypothetical protein
MSFGSIGTCGPTGIQSQCVKVVTLPVFHLSPYMCIELSKLHVSPRGATRNDYIEAYTSRDESRVAERIEQIGVANGDKKGHENQ